MRLYSFARAVLTVLSAILYRIKYEGLENIPKGKGYIIAGNHQGYYDPIFLGLKVPEQLRFMAKAEFFSKFLIGPLFRALGAFPIQRGTADRSGMEQARKIIADGGVLCIFPEGGRSRDGNPMRAKPGVAMLASTVQCGILPVGVSYKGKLHFRSRVTVRYGQFIPFDALGIEPDSSKSIRKAAIHVMDAIVREMDADCYEEEAYWG